MGVSDPWLIKLVGGVEGMERYPELMEQIGRYVTRYEPENAKRGEQWVWTSDDPDEALAFADPAELHRTYSQSVGTRPWDGRPDRPLTAFHITVARRSQFQDGTHQP